MKYIVIIVGLFMFQLSGFAQDRRAKSYEETEERIIVDGEGRAADTTKITIKKKTVTIIKDEDGRKFEIRDAEDILNEADEEFDVRRDEQDEWDEDYDYKPKERVEERNSSNVGLLGLDVGITNYYVNGRLGANAAAPEIAVRDFRVGSHVALHIFPTRVSLAGKGKVNLKTALTIDWSNYHFTDNRVTLVEGEQGLEFATADQPLSRNKLTTRYAQIPLLLNFNTAPGKKNNISLSVGGYGGLLWSAHTKQVLESDGTKIKTKGNYSLNPIRYGLTARLDFRWFDLYMNYNLSEMFVENEGPSTQTFEAGINIIDF